MVWGQTLRVDLLGVDRRSRDSEDQPLHVNSWFSRADGVKFVYHDPRGGRFSGHGDRSNCVLVASTGESATVHSFSNERKPFGKIPIGTVAMAWVNPSTGETFVLIFHEALFFGNCLDHSLLCPNQLRAHGVKVYDTPKSFEPGSPHAIMLDDPELKEITIPLRLRGVFSYFDTHQPTEEEMENCCRIVLTSEEPWNPNDATERCHFRRAGGVGTAGLGNYDARSRH